MVTPVQFNAARENGFCLFHIATSHPFSLALNPGLTAAAIQVQNEYYGVLFRTSIIQIWELKPLKKYLNVGMYAASFML